MPVKRDPNKLNASEKRFCVLYVGNGRNATQAYQEVFPRVQRNTASANGHRWMTRPEIRAEVERLTIELFERSHMTAAEALARMAEIARSDIGDLVWKPGELDSAGNATLQGAIKPLFEMPEAVRKCIKSLKWDAQGRPEFSFWDKPSQLTNIGKHHKLLNESVDVNVQVGFADRLRQAREARHARQLQERGLKK